MNAEALIAYWDSHWRWESSFISVAQHVPKSIRGKLWRYLLRRRLTTVSVNFEDRQAANAWMDSEVRAFMLARTANVPARVAVARLAQSLVAVARGLYIGAPKWTGPYE